MPEHTIAAYVVSVKERRGDLRPLGNFDGKDADLLTYFQAFLTGLQANPWDDEEIESTLRASIVYPPNSDEPRVVAAMVEVGDYGIPAQIYNRNRYQDGVVFDRKPPHVETVPALVLAKFSAERKKGILVVHRPYGRGVKTKFWDEFREAFQKDYKGYSLQIGTLVPGDAWKQAIADGRITKVRLIRYRRPNDRFDGLVEEKFGQELGSVETVLHATKNRSLDKKPIEDAMTDVQAARSLLSLDNMDYDKAKVQVTIGDTSRTMDVESQRLPRLSLDITEEVEEDPDTNQPTYDSLRVQALEYVGVLEANPGWGDD